MSSASANLTPGRSSRSSSSTSTPAASELGVEAFGGFADTWRLRRVDGHQHHLEGRDGVRPDDAALIVVLLDGGGNDARHTDAVAAHVQGRRLAGFVEHGGAHGLAVLAGRAGRCGPTSMPRAMCKRALARGAGVAGDDVAHVGDASGSGQVAAPVHAGEVRILLVRAADEVAHRGDGVVGDTILPLEAPTGPEEAGLAPIALRDRVAATPCAAASRRRGSFCALTAFSS